MPSFEKTNLAYPNPMVSRIINKSGFKFVVYLGVMTKEIQTYCGLQNYEGPFLDYSTVEKFDCFTEEGELETYQKLARIVAVLYAYIVYKYFPEVEKVSIHRVDKSILSKHENLKTTLLNLIKA